MARMAILVSPELCIGCRACQTACKSWNQLPGDKTVNRGSFENPPDLTPHLYNKIHYIEVPSEKDALRWLFVNQRCMHCDDAGCMKICPSPGALYKTREGAVATNKEKCIGCKLCVVGCPFNVPRYDEKDKISKCHLCFDRIANGLQPACTKTCPTDALKYGDRDALIRSAQKAGYEKLYGQTDLGGLGALYAFKDAPTLYGYNEKPGIPETVVFWHTVLKPLSYIGIGGVVAASLIHYIAVGPHKEPEEEDKKNG
ncbi:MAG TPA: 4Fe-4S ferredoxin [Nitrospiraceae bacterium]|nr:4Fe-4S ferredoxin [Nitrospiraceae bacterium]